MIKFLLAMRYLIKRRIAYLAILTVALSVFVAFVVLTVMHGLVEGFKEKNHEYVGDCVVGTDSLVGFAYYDTLLNRLQDLACVQAVSPVVKSYGLYNYTDTDYGDGVQVVGVDPIRHSAVTGFGQSLFYRRDQVGKAFVPLYDPNLAGCVFGIDVILIRNHEGQYHHSDEPWPTAFDITCFPLTAKGVLARAGTGDVSTRRFYLSDTSQSGLARLDGSTVYIPLPDAQQLCGMSGPEPRISQVHVKFNHDVTVAQGTQAVTALWSEFQSEFAEQPLGYLLKTVTVQDWKRYCRSTIAAVEKEQLALIFMFMLVGATTVFIVLVIFHMIVSHKAKDIGILRSVGVSSWQIMGLYWGFASLVGVCGAFSGLTGGWVFLHWINRIEDWLNTHYHFQVWDRSMFAIGDIPNTIDPGVVSLIGIVAVLACLTGALIPAWQAARLQPIKTLQVNQL
jgi:ABC-type lipoprotein release transport system permease subunit